MRVSALLLPLACCCSSTGGTHAGASGSPALAAHGAIENETAFGGWAVRDGMPAFLYTADQTRVASAATPPNSPFGLAQFKDHTSRGDREHSTHIGNDRITLVGSNYGSYRIRADEGGPKWLTDSDVDHETGFRYGGGLAYVFDSATGQQLATNAFTAPGPPKASPAVVPPPLPVGTTYCHQNMPTKSDPPCHCNPNQKPPLMCFYNGNQPDLPCPQCGTSNCTCPLVPPPPAPPGPPEAPRAEPREFGVGYGTSRSPAGGAGVSVAHTVAVLPGVQPVALIEVVLTNHDAVARNVTVAEVWNTGMVHQLTGHGWAGWSNFTPTAFPALNQSARNMLDRRAFVAAHYTSSFSRFENTSGVGAVQRRLFSDLTTAERRFYEATTILPKW